MNVTDLQKHGFVTVEYPRALRRTVHAAMDSWIQFCKLTDTEKRVLSGGDRIEDYGYVRRLDMGSKADNKEYFHLMKKRAPEFLEKSANICDRRALEFLQAGDSLIAAIQPIIMRFAHDMETAYRMKGFAQEVERSSDVWTFRYLHYFGGDTLANSHADRLGFTLHLDETDTGGHYLCVQERKWKPWPVNHQQTIIFPSLGLQHRSRNQVKALWHKVEPTEQSKREGRFAMVAFIDFPQEREWDKYKHTRVQDLPEGFNYDLTFEKLDTEYFAPQRVVA